MKKVLIWIVIMFFVLSIVFAQTAKTPEKNPSTFFKTVGDWFSGGKEKTNELLESETAQKLKEGGTKIVTQAMSAAGNEAAKKKMLIESLAKQLTAIEELEKKIDTKLGKTPSKETNKETKPASEGTKPSATTSIKGCESIDGFSKEMDSVYLPNPKKAREIWKSYNEKCKSIKEWKTLLDRWDKSLKKRKV